MAPQFAARALGLVSALVLMSSVHATAETAAAERGKAILQEKCARCHAVEAVGTSPLAAAPPLREIYARYALRELQERFSEGLASRHKDMPQIQFSDEDTHAILTYLYALAVRN